MTPAVGARPPTSRPRSPTVSSSTSPTCGSRTPPTTPAPPRCSRTVNRCSCGRSPTSAASTSSRGSRRSGLQAGDNLTFSVTCDSIGDCQPDHVHQRRQPRWPHDQPPTDPPADRLRQAEVSRRRGRSRAGRRIRCRPGTIVRVPTTRCRPSPCTTTVRATATIVDRHRHDRRADHPSWSSGQPIGVPTAVAEQDRHGDVGRIAVSDQRHVVAGHHLVVLELERRGVGAVAGDHHRGVLADRRGDPNECRTTTGSGRGERDADAARWPVSSSGRLAQLFVVTTKSRAFAPSTTTELIDVDNIEMFFTSKKNSGARRPDRDDRRGPCRRDRCAASDRHRCRAPASRSTSPGSPPRRPSTVAETGPGADGVNVSTTVQSPPGGTGHVEGARALVLVDREAAVADRHRRRHERRRPVVDHRDVPLVAGEADRGGPEIGFGERQTRRARQGDDGASSRLAPTRRVPQPPACRTRPCGRCR